MQKMTIALRICSSALLMSGAYAFNQNDLALGIIWLLAGLFSINSAPLRGFSYTQSM